MRNPIIIGGQEGNSFPSEESIQEKSYNAADEIILRLFRLVQDEDSGNGEVEFYSVIQSWLTQLESEDFMSCFSDGFNKIFEGCDVQVVGVLMKKRLLNLRERGETEGKLYLEVLLREWSNRKPNRS